MVELWTLEEMMVGVAHIKSALKKAELSRINNARNKAVKSNLKSTMKRARALLSPEMVKEAVSTIDRAAARGVIHKNAANRYKSRIMRSLAAGLEAKK